MYVDNRSSLLSDSITDAVQSLKLYVFYHVSNSWEAAWFPTSLFWPSGMQNLQVICRKSQILPPCMYMAPPLEFHQDLCHPNTHGWRKVHKSEEAWTCERKGKGKEEYLYSAFYILCISQSAQAWITVLPANAPCLPFLRMRSPDGATSNWGKRHLIAAYYSSIDPEGMKGWVDLVGWPIADGLLT